MSLDPVTDAELEADMLECMDRLGTLKNPCAPESVLVELRLAWFSGYRRGLAYARTVYNTPGERT